MPDPIIEVKNIGKKYNISSYRGGYVALRDILTNALKNPYAAAKYRLNSWAGKIHEEEYWALKDVNFSVQPGEALGIIGPNGAGKSTLLKILTRITWPTTGEVRIHGRVSSLLEVGTGFHPELTGRENIFLNGAILGMKQSEIKKKFDDIVEFSGVSKFVDTPVKHYSSGMYVRLAFAVAAHLEPDILLVDEVLAVGDAAFQKKCIGKMNEVTKASGRTVLFVSHNMSAIQALCQKTILLDQGRLVAYGETKEVINKYLSVVEKNIALGSRTDRKGTGKVHLVGFHLESRGKRVTHLKTGGEAVFCFEYESKSGKPVKNASFASAITLENDTPITLNWSKATNQDFSEIPANGVVRCKISQKLPLVPGIYKISGTIFVDNDVADLIKYLGLFEVKEGDYFGTGFNEKHSPLYFDQDWTVSKK